MRGYSFLDIYQYPQFWNESIDIYINSFNEHEREDTDKIYKNIQNNNYKMFSCLQDNEIVGFYILDINHTLNYAICTFLAVKTSKRTLGFGTKLCLNAIEYFQSNIKCNWFLIEAKNKQARLYEKLGFKKMNLDYQIPIFNSQNSIKTNLMIIQRESKIDKISLLNIIKDIFQRGYSLDENDRRIINQLDRISSIQTL